MPLKYNPFTQNFDMVNTQSGGGGDERLPIMKLRLAMPTYGLSNAPFDTSGSGTGTISFGRYGLRAGATANSYALLGETFATTGFNYWEYDSVTEITIDHDWGSASPKPNEGAHFAVGSFQPAWTSGSLNPHRGCYIQVAIVDSENAIVSTISRTSQANEERYDYPTSYAFADLKNMPFRGGFRIERTKDEVRFYHNGKIFPNIHKTVVPNENTAYVGTTHRHMATAVWNKSDTSNQLLQVRYGSLDIYARD